MEVSNSKANIGNGSNGLPIQEDLSLNDVVSMIDVASVLKSERLQAINELENGDLKEKVRLQIRQAAQLDGEELSDKDIDTAIEAYFENRFVFLEPASGFKKTLAKLYVNRGVIYLLLALVFLGLASWWFFLSPYSPYYGDAAVKGRLVKKGNRLLDKINRKVSVMQSIIIDPNVNKKLKSFQTEATAISENISTDEKVIDRLEKIARDVNTLQTTLDREFTVKVVNRVGERSGIDRKYRDGSGMRNSGYYLIVEALGKKGNIIPLDITSAETGKTQRVKKWGESVPRDVFQQIAADKKDDGIIQHNIFAVKTRGDLDWTIHMFDRSGKRVQRKGQIFTW